MIEKIVGALTEEGADGAIQGGGSLLSLLPGGGNLVSDNINHPSTQWGDIRRISASYPNHPFIEA